MSSLSHMEGFKGLVGKDIGRSDWFTVTQQQIDAFAEVTHDPDPMHIDPKWCEENSPFKSPIAFGFLTISMLTYLNRIVADYSEQSTAKTGGYPLNYGFDRLRLITPVPVNSRIRASFKLLEYREQGPGKVILKTYCEIEIEGESRPAMIAEWLSMWVANEGHEQVAQQYQSTHS